MKKIGIFYGSGTGTTGEIAERIAEKLGLGSEHVYDISSVDLNVLTQYDLLILGTSTWGSGDLQDDWDNAIGKVKKLDLSGKAVALFGLGDSGSFSDSFCSGMSILYRELQGSGVTFYGWSDPEEYEFEDSESVVDGKFVGLVLDETNESTLTNGRIDKWIDLLKKDCPAS